MRAWATGLMGLIGLGLMACGDEAGAGGEAGDAQADAADSEADAAPPDTGVHAWAVVVDDSESDQAGTPGADICGLAADCGDGPLVGVEARLSPGDGELCDVVDDGCSADRSNPTAALDDGSDCEPGSVPSDYVSLGVGGTLSVRFGRGLAGCRLTVEELVGNQSEGYEVFVCADPMDRTTCLLGGRAVGRSDHGGPVGVDLPLDMASTDEGGAGRR